MSRYAEIINSDSKQSEKDQIVSNPLNDSEDAQVRYGAIDPRSDKSVDHQYWEDILWNAWHFVKPLFYTLHGIRCGGGELTLTKDSFRLLPGEWVPAEWEKIKKVNLNPVKEKLIWILKLTRAGKVSEEQLPEGVFGENNVKEQGKTEKRKQEALF